MARDVRLGAGSKTHEHDTLAKWTGFGVRLLDKVVLKSPFNLHIEI
jgi:hypothetical protein